MSLKEIEQDNQVWPPSPASPKVGSGTHNRTHNFGSPSELVPGIVAGFLLHVVVVIVGSISILIIGTLILGPSQPGQTVYKPILPYPVLDALFMLCHLPALALFLRLRRRKGFLAYGLLVGSPAGMAFLIWLWMWLSSNLPDFGFS